MVRGGVRVKEGGCKVECMGGGREGTAGKVVDMHAVSPAAKPEGL